MPYFEDIHVDYEPGSTHEVEMPDGSHVYLKKLGADYDPTSRENALQVLEGIMAQYATRKGLTAPAGGG